MKVSSMPPSPEHPIEQVTVERLAELFLLLDADYELINKTSADGESLPDSVLQTGLAHVVIHFDIEADTLSAFASWEGRLPAAEEDRLARHIADTNWTASAPNLSYVTDLGSDADSEPQLLIGASRAMGVGQGLSNNQLGCFIISAMDSFDAAFAELEELFPHAAPWRKTRG